MKWVIMKWVIIAAVTVFYLVGILIRLDYQTSKDFEVHNDWFMPYTTHTNRDVTTLDMWISLCWPVLFICNLLRMFVWLLHELFSGTCLLLGMQYSKTQTYKYIAEWLSS